MVDTTYSFVFDGPLTSGVPVEQTGSISADVDVDYAANRLSGSITYDTPESGEVTDNFTQVSLNDNGTSVVGDVDFFDEAGTEVKIIWNGTTPTTLFQVQLGLPEGSQDPFGATFEDDSMPVTVTVNPPCFVSGVHIRTSFVETAVEQLAVGDLVVAASGERRPIRWLGHRVVDCAAHPRPESVWPIRVVAGALAPGAPRRDLWLSPGHSLHIGGRLIQAERLVNGATIVQQPCESVTYWHVELDSHDILFAEGVEAESYLDCGNRVAFANGGAFLELHPDFAPKVAHDTCVPFIEDGAELTEIRRDIWRRAEALGHRRDGDPDLHVLADGERIEAIELGGDRFAFVIPGARRSVQLASRTWIPAEALAGADHRSLGVWVGRLRVDGAEAPIGDLNAPGWSHVEYEARRPRRWTTGAAQLPEGARVVIVDLVGAGQYLSESGTCSRSLQIAVST